MNANKKGARNPFESRALDYWLDSLNVFRLPALGTLGHLELHSLSFLQAAKAARLNRREVHENVFAILTADEAVTFGVVKPLYCSLFHFMDVPVSA